MEEGRPSSKRKGLSVPQYFLSTQGARTEVQITEYIAHIIRDPSDIVFLC